MKETLQLALQHWKLVLLVWCMINVVNAMPSPNGTGVCGTAWYRMLFTAAHGIFGCVPRLLAVVFPAAWAVFTGVSTTAAGNTAATSRVADLDKPQ